MACGGMLFPDTGCFVKDVGNNYLVWVYSCMITVSTFIHIPKILYLRTMNLIYISYTYWTKNYQQECSRLGNRFSLQCYGPRMNNLPPVWCFIFRFIPLKYHIVCKFGIVKQTFLFVSCLYIRFCSLIKFCLLFILSSVFTLYIYIYFKTPRFFPDSP